MFIFGKLWIAFLAAGMLVLGLQPVYFAAMANLNRVISHEATWEHVRDAFNAGVLETSYHSRNQYIDSGDRFTDCYSLGVGLEPGVGSAVAGITASRPASDRHACDDLKDAAENPNGVTWNRYARYWHGYRLYSAPLASAFPIVAVKLINLLLLVTTSILLFNQGARLVGTAPMIGLFAPVLFCSDYVRIWHVTPHTVSTLVIVGGSALFALAVYRKAPPAALIVLSAAFGSIFNFVDFLVNPPWMPMLLAFFVMAAPEPTDLRKKAAIALLCASIWFGAYALTWFAKWVSAYLVDPAFDIKSDVLSTMTFRIVGDDVKVMHFPLVATLKMRLTCVTSWGLPLAALSLVVVAKTLRGRKLDRKLFFFQAWPVLIPVLWFETLSRHSQMHAFFVARSAAAALGVIIAAALLAANVTGADLGRSFKLQVPEKRASGT